MGKYILKRLIIMIPVVLGVTILIFTIMYFTPGDPASIILGPNASQEQLMAKNEELGLNTGYFERLFNYIKDLFFRFDFGKSYINNRSVSGQILERFPRTVTIAFLSVIISLVVGIPLGIIAAINQYSWKDNASMLLALVGVSMPNFWVGLLLVILFALTLGWLPPGGIGGLKFYILPCIATSLGGAANIARQTRSSMLEVIRADYIVTARAKGQVERKVIYKHALRNALIPIITIAGASFGILIGGTLVIETVFSIPGLGSYMTAAISNRDYPAIQGSVIFLSILFGLVMLLVDILYAFIDPRIKGQYQKNKKKGE
ncbi:MAG: ABC transporter permease [Eubacteriales bacterium]